MIPRPHSLLAALFCSLLFPGISSGSEPFFSSPRLNDSAPHIRVGVSVRKIGVKFTVSPSTGFSSTLMDSPNRTIRRSGAGDVGLYRGGRNPVVYDNGSVGGPGSASGDAVTTIESGLQLSDPGRSLPPGSDFPLQQVEYTSSERTVSTLNNAGSVSPGAGNSSLSTEDEEVVIGPQVEFVLPLLENEKGHYLNFVAGYSFHHSSHGTGMQDLGTVFFQTATSIRQTDYVYRYDYVGTASPSGSFPYSGFGAVYDIVSFQNNVLGRPADLRAPERSSSSRLVGFGVSPFQAFEGVSRTEVNVDLHEIPIGFEWGVPLGKGNLGVKGGVTLNIVELGIYNRTDWFTRGGTGPFATEIFRSGDTTIEPGAFLGVNFTHPLSGDGRLYLEVHGSYRWVDSVSSSLGNASFEVDLSSWEGGIGIGCIY